MMTLWAIYCLTVSALLAVAANVCEHALRGRGMPIRWVWISTIAGSLLLPIWGFANSAGSDASTPVVRSVAQTFAGPSNPVANPGSEISSAPVTMRNEPAWLERTIAPAGPVLKALSPGLLVAWLASSVWMGTLLLEGWLRLRAERGQWQRVRVSGRDVMISNRTGPAVVGIVRPGIVLPRWFLKLENERRELVLVHEEEHLRAHDERLLFLARLALISMPCNLALWYQVQRLRLAVEIDCDARVLRVHPDARVYGNLLLDVGRRVNSGSLQQMAALSEPVSFLARRVDAMMVVRRQSRTAASIALAMAAAMVTIACYTPRPPGAPLRAGPRSTYSQAPRASTRVDSLPVVVWDGERMTRDSLVRRLYGKTLSLAGAGVLEFVVDSDDVVRSAGVRSSPTVYRSADTTRVTGEGFDDGYAGVQAADVASIEVDRRPYGFPEITSVIWVTLKPGVRVSDNRDRARATRSAGVARVTVRNSAGIDSSRAVARAARSQAASADSLARLLEQLALQMARHETEAARFEGEMARHQMEAARFERVMARHAAEAERLRARVATLDSVGWTSIATGRSFALGGAQPRVGNTVVGGSPTPPLAYGGSGGRSYSPRSTVSSRDALVAAARRYYPEIVSNPPATPVTLWFLADTADRVVETVMQRSALGTVGLPEVINVFPAVSRELIKSWTVTSPFPFGIVWVRVKSLPPPR